MTRRLAFTLVLMLALAARAQAVPHTFTFVTPCTMNPAAGAGGDSLACATQGTLPLLNLAAVELWGVKQGDRFDRKLTVKPLTVPCVQESLFWAADSGFVWTCWVVFVRANGVPSCHSNYRTINAAATVPPVTPAVGTWSVYDIQGRLRATYSGMTRDQAVTAAKALPQGVYWVVGPERVSIYATGHP